MLERDDLKLGGPKSLDDLPRWLAAAASALKVHWTGRLRFGTNLRGNAKLTAMAWVFAERASKISRALDARRG